MAMAVKSSFAYSAIGLPSPECWSSTGWDPESLPADSAWEWEDPHPSYTTIQGPQQSSPGWASVTVASSVTGASKSDDESSPVYALNTSTASASSGVARASESSSTTVVKDEPNESLYFRSLSREREDGSPEEEPPKSNGSNSSEGEHVGLKLGRKTYLEDSLGGKPGPGDSLPLSPPGKKQRPLSPNSQVPRCQVEGCKADLSGCKDYHKRHKVCAMHSKAPKAIAGGIEQRFCQQCSRFHLLKEFDEGKRSCRRRLAGHNERRRKPHPTEAQALFGLANPFLLQQQRETSLSTVGGTPFYFPEDIKPSSTVSHPHTGSLLDYGLHSYGPGLNRASPWSLKSGGSDTIPTFQMQDPKPPITTSLKPSPGLNLGGRHHHPHFLDGSLGPLGQSLSLSSSTGGMLGNMEQTQQPQPQSHCSSQSLSSVSGMMDSDRALSLLSSQSWAPRPPLSTSAPPQQAPLDSTLEHLVASSSSHESSNRGGGSRLFSPHHHQLLPVEGSSSTTSAAAHLYGNKPFSMPAAVVDSGGLNFGLTATGTRSNDNMLAGFRGLGYEETTNSMLTFVGQNGQDHARFGSSPQARASTMDLMQTLHNNGVHSQAYNSHGFRSFEASRFSGQQLL